MAYQRKLPDTDVLLRHRDEQGMSVAEIARAYGVSHWAVDRRLIAAGVARPSQHRYLDELPWRMEGEHMLAWEARCLRHYARERRGLPLTAAEQRRLDEFKAALGDDLVIDYNPEVGFHPVPREDADDGGYSRRPKAAVAS